MPAPPGRSRALPKHEGKSGSHAISKVPEFLGLERRLDTARAQKLAAGFKRPVRCVKDGFAAIAEFAGPLQGIRRHVRVKSPGGGASDRPGEPCFYCSWQRGFDKDTQVGPRGLFLYHDRLPSPVIRATE